MNNSDEMSSCSERNLSDNSSSSSQSNSSDEDSLENKSIGTTGTEEESATDKIGDTMKSEEDYDKQWITMHNEDVQGI